MAKPVSSLETHLGYWLRQVSNQVSHAFAMKLSERGISVAEWVALRILYDGPLAPSALAENMAITRGAVSKLADRLAAKSLIAISADGPDRRYQSLALTRDGRTAVPHLAALADQNDDEFFGHLPAAERSAVKATMQEISRRRGLKAPPTD